MKYYDLIIVGAGIAGCILAKKMAEAGFEVALLDKKARRKIGHPWEVAIEHNTFRQLVPESAEEYLMEEEPLFYRFFTDNPNYYIQMDSRKAFVVYIQHKKLNQLVIESAIKSPEKLSGQIDFFGHCLVYEPVIHNGSVCGVKAIKRSLGTLPRRLTIMGRVVVDASGFSRVLCRYLPEDFEIETKIATDDVVTAYQEVREIKPDGLELLKSKHGFEPEIHYTSIGLHKAYQVVHLRKNNTANLIFGAGLNSPHTTASKLAVEFLKAYPYFGNKISGGGSYIPVRHSISSMVGNGFLCLGDAACQVIPVMGSGVSSGVHAAGIAAGVLTAALTENNLSKARLWEYNYQYQSRRGAILASYDLFRRYLQFLPIEELGQIFKAGLIADENFSQIYTAKKIIYNFNQILNDLRKILSDLNLLPLGLKLLNLVNRSGRILNLYRHYCKDYNTAEFINWQKKVAKVFRITPDKNSSRNSETELIDTKILYQ